MGLRENVESILTIEDTNSVHDLKDVLQAVIPVCVSRQRRMARHLLAFLTTDDGRDQDIDDANMRAVAAEVGQGEAEDALRRLTSEIVVWADLIEDWNAGDTQTREIAELAERMRKFIA